MVGDGSEDACHTDEGPEEKEPIIKEPLGFPVALFVLSITSQSSDLSPLPSWPGWPSSEGL